MLGDWVDLGKAMPIGTLRSDLVRGEEVFSFEYDLAWLGSRHAIMFAEQEAMRRAFRHAE